jgi:hypothetical protein
MLFLRGVEVNIIKMGVYDVTKGYVTEATGWSRKDIKTSFEYEGDRVYIIIED